MSALAQLQRRFMDELLGDGPCDAGMRVYRRNLRANHEQALAAAYPVVKRLVGDAFFAEAAARYGREAGSRSGDLHRLGDRFAEYLATYRHASGLPYLPDVARLEWALHEAFHAADAPSLDFAALARVAPGDSARLRLRLHPSVRLLRARHPVLAIWEANQPERDGTPQRDELEAPEERVRVARVGGVPQARRVDALEWALLAGFAAGASLEEAVEGIEAPSEGALAQALSRIAGEGLVCGFSL